MYAMKVLRIVWRDNNLGAKKGSETIAKNKHVIRVIFVT